MTTPDLPHPAPTLGRLNDLDEFGVADGHSDIRGWTVLTTDGRTVGTVRDLIVDTTAMRVRYLDVAVGVSPGQQGRDAVPPGDDDDAHTLLPIDQVQLDDARGQITIDPRTLEQLLGLRRTASRPAEPRRLTLSEEQLQVRTRTVPAGEVEVRKLVDTHHVQQEIDVSRDEVTVERRPITDAADLDTEPLAEGEIRIPVMEERLVVEKRLVPVEQIIVRRRQVTDRRTVEADLRRERVEIDDPTRRSPGQDADPHGRS